MSKLFSFEAFRGANPEKTLGGYDYLQMISAVAELPADFIVWFSRLFSPQFILVEGNVLIDSLFEPQRYEELRRNGKSAGEAQFWINLLEVTGLFAQLTVTQAEELAEGIVDAWNMKLDKEFPLSVHKARSIHDQETNEIFVVIGKPDQYSAD